MGERNNLQQPQQSTGSAENTGDGRSHQFNEMTELSLEERMNMADKLGVPVENIVDESQTGTVSGRDDLAGGSGDPMQDEDTGETSDQ